MRRPVALLAALLLTSVAGCGERLPAGYVFSGPQPPAPGNVTFCRSLCEKAACKPDGLDQCLSSCAELRDCENEWRGYLTCQMGASTLSCSDDGVVQTTECRDLGRLYQSCIF